MSWGVAKRKQKPGLPSGSTLYTSGVAQTSNTLLKPMPLLPIPSPIRLSLSPRPEMRSTLLELNPSPVFAT